MWATCATCAACTDHSSSSVVLTALPRVSLANTPVSITLRGARASQLVTVNATALSAATASTPATRFSSSATFQADGTGHLDLARTAPRSGDYQGVDAMGLLQALHPPTGDSFRDVLPPGGQPVTLTATVAGQTRASVTLLRQLAGPGVTSRSLSMPQAGFIGQMFSPPSDGHAHPALLIFGGSEGDNVMMEVASQLASAGYPALAIAYFKDSGLPPELTGIPLEYFATALRWLSHQPGVDPARIVVDGASRGSEAALLLGIHYPDLVSGVVALTPANVVGCGYPDCGKPAWTLNGRPLAYQRSFGPAATPAAAAITVEDIHGPLLLDCGGDDNVWPSCPMADAIIARRQAHRIRYQDRLLAFPQAGHGVNYLMPYQAYRTLETEGRDALSNQQAVASVWPQLLDFLRRLPAN